MTIVPRRKVQSAAASSSSVSPYAFVVFSMDSTHSATLKDTLEQLGLKHDSVVLSASDHGDVEMLKKLLNRRPITCDDDDGDDDGAWEPRSDHSRSMTCLLIARCCFVTIRLLAPLQDQIIRWAEHGGIVMVHGSNSLAVLQNWFGRTEWQRANPSASFKSLLNKTSLLHQLTSMPRHVGLLPEGGVPWRDLPRELGDDGQRLYLSNVADGEAVYSSAVSPSVCSVAWSEFGLGGVGFLGGVDKEMISIAAHIANREWIPEEEEEADEHQEEETDDEDVVEQMETDDEGAAPQPVAAAAGAAASPVLVVLVLSSNDREKFIRRTLDTAGLQQHSIILTLRGGGDRFKALLNRPPLLAPQSGSSSMACLWIVDYTANDESRLKEYQSKLTHWVELGGVLMVHGGEAPLLLKAWFKTRWKHHKAIKWAALNISQLSPQRSVKLLPSADRPLPKSINHDSRCLSGVAAGDAVYRYRSADKELSPLTLAEYGASHGCIGYVGAIKMLPIIVQLINRWWSPAPRAVKSAPCTSIKSFVDFALQCPDPKRKHLLSMVVGHVPSDWTLRAPSQGCVHSCCYPRRPFASGETLRGHASNEGLHASCDKRCAIWKSTQTDSTPIAAAAASSAAAALPSPRTPSLDTSSSSSAAAAASAAPRPIPVLARPPPLPKDASMVTAVVSSPIASAAASSSSAAASAEPHVPTATASASRSAVPVDVTMHAAAAAASSVPSNPVAASSAVTTADSLAAPALSGKPPKPIAAAQESRSVDVAMVPAALASLASAKPIAVSSSAAVSAQPQPHVPIAVVERPAMDAPMLPVAAAVPIAAAASFVPPALAVVPAAASVSVPAAVPAASSSALPHPIAAAAPTASSSAPLLPSPFAAFLQSQRSKMTDQQAMMEAMMKAQRESYDSLFAMLSPEFVHRISIPNDHPQIVSLQAQIAQLRQQLTSAQAQNGQLTQERDSAIAQHGNLAQKSAQQHELASAQIRQLTEQCAQLTQERDAATAQILQLTHQSAQLTQQRDAAAVQIQLLTGQRDAAQARIMAHEATIVELRQLQQAAEDEIKVKREVVQHERNEKRKAEDAQEGAEQERKEASNRQRMAEATAAAAQRELAAAAQRAEALEAQKSALEEQVPTCSLCLDKPQAVCFTPCGHRLCVECNAKHSTSANPDCPFCRRAITHKQTMFA